MKLISDLMRDDLSTCRFEAWFYPIKKKLGIRRYEHPGFWASTKILFSGLLVLASSAVLAQPLEVMQQTGSKVKEARYIIGVVDTGYDPGEADPSANIRLCKTGHYDYLTKTPNLAYTSKHGTQIMNLIAQKLNSDVDYCFVVYQITDDLDHPGADPGRLGEILLKAIASGVDVVNMSLNSSQGLGQRVEAEEAAFKAAAANGMAVFLASGNAGAKLDKVCDYYPACYGPYQNLVIVGGQKYEDPKEPDHTFNYGSRVSVYAPSWYRDPSTGAVYYGTSYAAPRALAEYILALERKRLGK